MRDLIAALGLAFALEGMLVAAFPDRMRRAMEAMAQTPADRLRVTGLVSAVVGVAILWLVRRYAA